eukprot:2988143-Pleurochrysis_carterae.AAC.1
MQYGGLVETQRRGKEGVEKQGTGRKRSWEREMRGGREGQDAARMARREATAKAEEAKGSPLELNGCSESEAGGETDATEARAQTRGED